MKRLSWLDAIKGFAMVCVVIGHMPIERELKIIIYSFHMPLFFMLSGFSYGLSKKTVPWLVFVKKKAQQLLVPYFLLNAFVLPLWILNHEVLYNSSNSILKVIVGSLYANQAMISMISNALWFLPFLFVLSIVFYAIEQTTKRNRSKMNVWIIGAALMSVILNLFDIRIAFPWHLQTLFPALCFYYLGYVYCKDISLQQLLARFSHPSIAFACFIFGVLVALVNGKVSMHMNNYHSIALFYLSATLISFALVAWFQKTKQLPFLSFIGRNTLIILAFHNGLLWFLKRVSPYTRLWVKQDPIIVGVCILFACLPIAVVMNRNCPKAVGR